MEPKGAKSEPKDAKREPKGAKMETKSIKNPSKWVKTDTSAKVDFGSILTSFGHHFCSFLHNFSESCYRIVFGSISHRFLDPLNLENLAFTVVKARFSQNHHFAKMTKFVAVLVPFLHLFGFSLA
jgi:hypothetical protein